MKIIRNYWDIIKLSVSYFKGVYIIAIRIHDRSDLRRYMNNIINEVRAGTLEPEKASKLGYLCNILCKVLHLAWEESRMLELEQRLTALETNLQQQED